MAEKRPPLPLILTANDLMSGATVYWTGAGWSESLRDALVAQDDAAATALDERRHAGEASGEVIEPYLATVAIDAGGIMPVHYRERIRIIGPTFRDDFGRNRPGVL